MSQYPAQRREDYHPSDEIGIWRKKGEISGLQYHRAPVLEYLNAAGVGVGECDNICTTEVTDDYTMYKTEYPNGEFDIKIKYKVSCDRDYTITLFEQENAQLYFDNMLDVVVTEPGGFYFNCYLRINKNIKIFPYNTQLTLRFLIQDYPTLITGSIDRVVNIDIPNDPTYTTVDILTEIKDALALVGIDSVVRENYSNNSYDSLLINYKPSLQRYGRLDSIEAYFLWYPGTIYNITPSESYPDAGQKYELTITYNDASTDVVDYTTDAASVRVNGSVASPTGSTLYSVTITYDNGNTETSSYTTNGSGDTWEMVLKEIKAGLSEKCTTEYNTEDTGYLRITDGTFTISSIAVVGADLVNTTASENWSEVFEQLEIGLSSSSVDCQGVIYASDSLQIVNRSNLKTISSVVVTDSGGGPDISVDSSSAFGDKDITFLYNSTVTNSIDGFVPIAGLGTQWLSWRINHFYGESFQLKSSVLTYSGEKGQYLYETNQTDFSPDYTQVSGTRMIDLSDKDITFQFFSSCGSTGEDNTTGSDQGDYERIITLRGTKIKDDLV